MCFTDERKTPFFSLPAELEQTTLPCPQPTPQRTILQARRLIKLGLEASISHRPSNMASKPKSPILSAPLEIRYEIYRYAWTIPIDPKTHFEPRSPGYLNDKYFRLQLGQLHTLVSICRQMRQEVLWQHFHRTQVYLRWYVGLRNMPHPGLDAIRCIESSRLLTHYTRHVSLHWEPCLCSRDFEGRRIDCQHWDWLLKLEQLKTLELIIKEGLISLMDKCGDIPESNLILFCPVCFSKLMKLRNLEKVVFKVKFKDYTTAAQKQKVERSKWFAEIKKIVSDMILKAPNQEEQQPTYLIEQHIGTLDTKWTRSYKI